MPVNLKLCTVRVVKRCKISSKFRKHSRNFGNFPGFLGIFQRFLESPYAHRDVLLYKRTETWEGKADRIYYRYDSWIRLHIFEAIQSTKIVLIKVWLLLNKYDEKALLHYYNISSLFKKKKKHQKALWQSKITALHLSMEHW